MEKSISSDLIRGHIDTIILHTLINGNKYAQQISDTIIEKSNNQYEINQATLYSSLKRLETLKYVKAYWHDADNGRRRYFSLTEQGRKFVDDNLNNWTFSRAIIDKLVDCETSPIIKTEYVEKIVNVPVEIEKPVVIENVKENSENKKSDLDASTQNNKLNDVQEINFRSILNGLIKTTEVKKDNISLENTEIKENVVIEENSEPKKLNQTILSESTHKKINGKIDFTDIVENAKAEGLKVRVSSKEPKRDSGALRINKVNMFSALGIFLLAIVEVLIITLTCKSILNLSFWPIFLTLVVLAIYPIVSVLIFIFNPKTVKSKNIKADSILTSLIVVFNLLLVTFAIDLIVGVDFSKTNLLLLTLILPTILYIDIFLFFVLRYYFSKNKNFRIK